MNVEGLDPKAWGRRYGPNGQYDPNWPPDNGAPKTPYKPDGGGCCGCMVVLIVIVVIVVILVILQRATYHPLIHTHYP